MTATIVVICWLLFWFLVAGAVAFAAGKFLKESDDTPGTRVDTSDCNCGRCEARRAEKALTEQKANHHGR